MTGIPCSHLEKLIQSGPTDSVKASSSDKIDSFYYESGAGYAIPKEIRDRIWETQFRDKLTKTGLEQVKVDILVYRFVYEMSMKEIAEELGFLSISSVLNFLNDSLRFLKKIGFNKR